MIRVDKSPIHGEGLFSCEDIKSGQRILITHFYSEQHEDWVNITPNCMYNHSFSPNCQSITVTQNGNKLKFLYSLKIINNNEELLVDFTKDKDLEQPEKEWK